MSAPLQPLPLTVISGYLGAGKTTLLNAILARPLGQVITVLVNDFGEIAIDESLIDNQTGDTIALTNGCVCCTIGGDLFDAIDRILSRQPRPDRLIIETSGVADPAKISQIAVAEPELAPDRTVTLVDCVNILHDLVDPLLADSLLRQLRAADLIVLTKTDLTDAAQSDAVLEALAKARPGIPVHATGTNTLASETLFQASRSKIATTPAHDHGVEYATWSYCGPATVGPKALKSASRRSQSGCLRLKGYARAPGGECFAVQRAGMQWTQTKTPASDPATRLVAIGLAGEFSAAALNAALGLSRQ